MGLHSSLVLPLQDLCYSMCTCYNCSYRKCEPEDVISHLAVLLPQSSTLMFMERLEEREAVIRSFTVPQIHPSISLSLFFPHTLSPKHTNSTHALVYPISSPTTPSPLLNPPPFHPLSGSSRHHLSSSATPEKPIQTFCSTPSWHVGQGRWSPFRFWATTSLPPSLSLSLPPRCSSTFPQHAWCISRMARQQR